MDAEEHRDELRKGQAKKETEGFITAAQSQALRKNSKKKSLIDKQNIPPKFRLSVERGDCKNRFKKSFKKSFQSKKVIPIKKKIISVKKKQ